MSTSNRQDAYWDAFRALIQGAPVVKEELDGTFFGEHPTPLDVVYHVLVLGVWLNVWLNVGLEPFQVLSEK